jgi:hypothetical protein
MNKVYDKSWCTTNIFNPNLCRKLRLSLWTLLFWKAYEGQTRFFYRGSFTIGNGEATRFWEDMWLGTTPLSHQYLSLSLYNITQRKNASVANVMSHVPLNVGFRQALTGSRGDRWTHLCTRLMGVTLSTQPDKLVWNLTLSGLFSVKPLYLDHMNDHTKVLRRFI